MSVRLIDPAFKVYLIDYYQSNGKRVQLKRKFENQSAAEQFEKDMLSREGKLPGHKMTVGEIINEYLPWCDLHNSHATIEDKAAAFQHIDSFFGKMIPDNIRLSDLEKYQALRINEIALGCRKDYGGRRTADKELTYFSGMIKWASDPDRGMCLKPLPKFSRLITRRQRPDYITAEDINRIIDAMDMPYKAIFLCMYHGGMRKEEVLNLRWDNVKFSGAIDRHATAAVITVVGKGNKRRIVNTTSRLLQALIDLAPCGLLEGLVFPDPRTGLKIDDLRYIIARAKKKCGITFRVTPHSFRHAFATHMIESGVDISVVKAALGHEDIATTQIYSHPGESFVKRSVLRTFDSKGDGIDGLTDGPLTV